jgi:hypothetical protein
MPHLLAFAFLLLAACPQDQLVLIPGNETMRTAPPIREACRVTEQKCSRCHDLERIKLAHHAMVDWPSYVEKMRLQPGSGITVDDKQVLLTCLNYLSQRQRDQDAGY